jgi:hypothetical protein
MTLFTNISHKKKIFSHFLFVLLRQSAQDAFLFIYFIGREGKRAVDKTIKKKVSEVTVS